MLSNIAFLIVMYSVYLVGQKKYEGQLLMAFSQLLWFGVGYNSGNNGLMAQSTCLFLMSIHIARKWYYEK